MHDFGRDEADAWSRTFKYEQKDFQMWGERNDHIQHYEKVFGIIFDRRESKGCAVLMKHRRKVKGKQMFILQMDQQLKNKNLSDLWGIDLN